MAHEACNLETSREKGSCHKRSTPLSGVLLALVVLGGISEIVTKAAEAVVAISEALTELHVL